MGGQEVWADDTVGLFQSILAGAALEEAKPIYQSLPLYVSKERTKDSASSSKNVFLPDYNESETVPISNSSEQSCANVCVFWGHTNRVRCVHSHCRDSSCAVEICWTPVLSSTPILKCHKGGIVFGPRPEQTVLEPIMFGTVLEPIMFGKVSLVTTEGLAGRWELELLTGWCVQELL